MHSTGRTPWDVLGLPEDAPFRDVKSAFQRKVKRAHPDVEGGSSEAFRELLAAYENLSRDASPEERHRRPTPTPRRTTGYDAWIAETPRPRHWDEPRDAAWVPPTGTGPRRPADFTSVLRDEMTRADRPAAAADAATRRPRAGAPLTVRPAAQAGRSLGGLLRRRSRKAA